MINELSTFFSDVGAKTANDIDINRISYIAISEWHWTEEELMECSIPFLFMLIEERGKDIKRQNDEMKKANRRK